MGSPVPCSFFFFFLMAGEAMERRFTPRDLPPSLPALGNKSLFSEEHSDVGGGCESVNVRAAATAVCLLPLPNSSACANLQNYSINVLIQCSGTAAYHFYKFVQTCNDA